MKAFFQLLCMLGFEWCLWSCSKIQSHSEIPEIHFKKLIVEDRRDTLDAVLRTAILTFSFIDGDGDIGVRPQDKNDPDNSRIYYTWYKKLPDMTYEPYMFAADSATIQSHEIPYKSVMNREDAQNKILKGTIEAVLVTPQQPHGLDTVRIEYYIVDRAKHRSNIDVTPDFSILNTTVDPIEAKRTGL